MQHITHYHSPIGDLLLAADEKGLTGTWFRGQKYFADTLTPEHIEEPAPIGFPEASAPIDFPEAQASTTGQNEPTRILALAVQWLDLYFSGKNPDFMPPVHLEGTKFQLSVWKLLQQIPYGETISYGELAKKIAKEKGISRMSAQAVGGAVGHNPVSIFVPCHRVVGTNGSLTGYAGGIQRKIELLTLEKCSSIKEGGRNYRP